MLNDRYQVRFRYIANGDNKDAVMFYRLTTLGGETLFSQHFAEDWATLWLPFFFALQHTSCAGQYVDVQNLDRTDDFYRENVTGYTVHAGTVGGEPHMSHVALRWTKNPADRSVGSGKLRICGLSEAMTNGKTYDAETYGDNVADVTAAIGTAITTNLGAVFTPCILRKIRIPTDPDEEFENWAFATSAIGGVTFLGLGHKVRN